MIQTLLLVLAIVSTSAQEVPINYTASLGRDYTGDYTQRGSYVFGDAAAAQPVVPVAGYAEAQAILLPHNPNLTIPLNLSIPDLVYNNSAYNGLSFAFELSMYRMPLYNLSLVGLVYNVTAANQSATVQTLAADYFEISLFGPIYPSGSSSFENGTCAALSPTCQSSLQDNRPCGGSSKRLIVQDLYENYTNSYNYKFPYLFASPGLDSSLENEVKAMWVVRVLTVRGSTSEMEIVQQNSSVCGRFQQVKAQADGSLVASDAARKKILWWYIVMPVLLTSYLSR